MKNIILQPIEKSFNLSIGSIASDKSISHRCAMFSLLSDKPSKITNFLEAEDTMNSLKIAEKLGASIEKNKDYIIINPPNILNEPEDVLDCGNAGTAMRLYIGLLSGVQGSFILSGDKYLRSRPMRRVIEPLKKIGAIIDGRENANKAPISIRGKQLDGFKYESPIDSAQVKSALILAALQGKNTSYYKEKILTRDHTERMLKGMGANISNSSDGWIKIEPLNNKLNALDLTVPSDPSSAFFFAAAAAIVPNSKVILKNLTLNPTRIEAYKVLEKLGTKVKYILNEDVYEPIGDIVVEYNELKATNVSENIPWLIDELPMLSIVMALAEGTSIVSNASELRVKESDRIMSVVKNLKLCGVVCKEFDDGYEIQGQTNLNSAIINSYGDHRIAMSFAIASLKTQIEIKDIECINTSFPNFFNILEQLRI